MDKQWRQFLREMAVPGMATVAGLIVGTIFIVAAGKNPLEAYQAFYYSVAGSTSAIGETLVSVTPLILTGLAVALAFRCGLFNIGVEGQYLMAQAATGFAGFSMAGYPYLNPTLVKVFGVVPSWLHAAVAILFGMVAGALWAAIPGLLKAYRGVHEVINSIMLNYTAFFFTHWLVMNKMRDPNGTAATPPVSGSAVFAQGLLGSSRLHVGIFIALVAAFLVWFFLWKTAAGYEIRSVGFAPGAAEYAGISVKRNIVLAMALSGALAGLAAAIQVLGISSKFYEPTGFVGYGFDGIAVALVGRNHPVGVVLAALLFGALDRGGYAMQMVGVPKTITLIVQGTVILLVAAEGLWRYVRINRTKTEVKAA